jgi:hypothetical protein
LWRPPASVVEASVCSTLELWPRYMLLWPYRGQLRTESDRTSPWLLCLQLCAQFGLYADVRVHHACLVWLRQSHLWGENPFSHATVKSWTTFSILNYNEHARVCRTYLINSFFLLVMAEYSKDTFFSKGGKRNLSDFY